MLNYINLSTLGGVSGPGYSILADPRLIDEAKIEQAVEANRDIIVGIKIMATGGALGAQGLKPLERARKLGDTIKIPLLIHIGESWTKDTEPVAIGDVLKYLRPATSSPICSRCIPAACSMPTANCGRRCATPKNPACSWTWAMACIILNFDVARKVLDQGLHPDGVSTDGHRGNRAGPVYDLPTTMAKLMALGFSLNQVVGNGDGRTPPSSSAEPGSWAPCASRAGRNSVLKSKTGSGTRERLAKRHDPGPSRHYTRIRHTRRHDLRTVAGERP